MSLGRASSPEGMGMGALGCPGMDRWPGGLMKSVDTWVQSATSASALPWRDPWGGSSVSVAHSVSGLSIHNYTLENTDPPGGLRSAQLMTLQLPSSHQAETVVGPHPGAVSRQCQASSPITHPMSNTVPAAPCPAPQRWPGLSYVNHFAFDPDSFFLVSNPSCYTIRMGTYVSKSSNPPSRHTHLTPSPPTPAPFLLALQGHSSVAGLRARTGGV